MLIGDSPKMLQLQHTINKLRKCRWPVLIQGETGTGKEVVARSIHEYRNQGPFVTIDCSAIVGPLMESDLFGHTKGAFTGASQSKAGLLELANGGTAFLDEIGELPIELQAKLLRVLQEKEFRPVGSLSQKTSDFRVISATNRDLSKEVEKGTFRADLYYRLNVVTLRLSPLRDRREDIPKLLLHFMQKHGRSNQEIEPHVLRALIEYDWPGNVRELENCVQHMLAVNSGPLFNQTDLPSNIQNDAKRNVFSFKASSALNQVPPFRPETFRDSHAISNTTSKTVQSGVRASVMPLALMEKQEIIHALTFTNGDRAEAAHLLGIGRTTLYRKLKEYNFEEDLSFSQSA